MMSRRIEDLSILPFTDEWYNIMHFKNSRLCSLSLTRCMMSLQSLFLKMVLGRGRNCVPS